LLDVFTERCLSHCCYIVYVVRAYADLLVCHRFFFVRETATTDTYPLHIVGSVRCV